MICVTIACGSHTRMVNEHLALAENGVKLVELRLDFLRRDPDVSRLIPERPTATVVTVRRPADGGLWKESEDKRITVLRAAIAAGPEFVDLEIDTAAKIPRFGKTRRIVSYHNLESTPDDLEALHREMASKDPDFIKIAATPQNVDDMFRLMRFVKAKNDEAKQLDDKGEKGVRVIGIAMGEMGQATRLLSKKFGMPYTYATFSSARIIAPGLMPYKEMLDLYHHEATNVETDVFGIIGYPIGHSLSPLIHNRSFNEQKINAVYVPFPLSNENDVLRFLELAPEWGIKGLSITIPHKVLVKNRLTKIDPAVDKIGACNTIVLKDGERLGYNTDYMAAVSSIELARGGKPTDEVSVLDGKSALVLGAGGAGMALAYGLKKRGALLTVVDVDGAKAFELAKHLDCEVADWKSRGNLKSDIVVNCTPVGMHPNTDFSPFDKTDLKAGMLVFDAVYNPERTLLLKSAMEKGCITVSGVEMFVGQACLQFKLFTGHKANAAFMRQLVKNAISAAKD